MISGGEELSQERAVRVAVIGAGPSGLYAVADLLRKLPDVRIDLYERDPTPFGLLRYGVAPDHHKIKALTVGFERTLADDRVRFHGNVWIGRDVSLESLRSSHDVVILAMGASAPRRLGIPGEDLAGSITASALVSWYNTQPDASGEIPLPVPRRSVTVVGAGNVALDVSRILLSPASALAATDIPPDRLIALEKSGVEEIQILVRRGVADVKFTLAELIELDKMEGLKVRVDPDDLVLNEGAQAAVATSPQLAQVVEQFRDWAGRDEGSFSKVLRFRFRTAPVRVIGSSQVSAVVLSAGGTHCEEPMDALISAVGFCGIPVPSVPSSSETGMIDNVGGRVAGLPGVYVVGWAKRGPSGVMGSNKGCARESVTAIMEDIETGVIKASCSAPAEPLAAMPDHIIVDDQGWRRIDEAERAAGAKLARPRVKLGSRVEHLAMARSQQS